MNAFTFIFGALSIAAGVVVMRNAARHVKKVSALSVLLTLLGLLGLLRGVGLLAYGRMALIFGGILAVVLIMSILQLGEIIRLSRSRSRTESERLNEFG
jgi:hypothetical protein